MRVCSTEYLSLPPREREREYLRAIWSGEGNESCVSCFQVVGNTTQPVTWKRSGSADGREGFSSKVGGCPPYHPPAGGVPSATGSDSVGYFTGLSCGSIAIPRCCFTGLSVFPEAVVFFEEKKRVSSFLRPFGPARLHTVPPFIFCSLESHCVFNDSCYGFLSDSCSHYKKDLVS